MRNSFLIAIASVAIQTPLAAQQTQPASTGATVLGVVYDSVRLRPMSGARIRLDSTSLVVTADSLGRFRMEDIPAGLHALHVEYHVLDTLGITLHTPATLFDSGDARAVALGTPSQETLVTMLCAPAWRARGPAALMGRVREADSGKPAVGAKVSLVWYEIDVAGGVQKVPRVREATVAPDGSYRICGLPSQLDGKVQVIQGALTSGDIPMVFGEDVLGLRSISIASPGAVVAATAGSDSTAAPTFLGTARLSGRVTAKMGRPLPGARVQLDGTPRVTTTRADGQFFMDSLPPGTQTVSVRLLGYTPAEAVVDLRSASTSTTNLVLEDFVPVLATVRVTAQRERGLDVVGFARRRRMGNGWYLDPEDVQRQNALRFSDLFQGAPGLRIQSYNGQQIISSNRGPMGGCVNVFIDGTQWQSMVPGDVDDYMRPNEVGAVEVYSPTSTPAEFTGPQGGSCSTIVAWTNQRLDRHR